MSYDYDLLVIGGGSGGIAAARRAANHGAKVGLAEFDRLGGTCVNRGCIPKKLMVYASHFPSLMQDAVGYGWSEVESRLDWPKMIAAVNDEVKRLNGVYQKMLDKAKVDVFEAYAKFVDAHTLDVGGKEVTADKVLIAVGGHPVKPDSIAGIEYAIVSDEMFHLKEQPKRLLIIGGGYIGCEFACMLHGMGTEVVQVIRSKRLLKGFDEDLRSRIQEEMQHKGIRLLTESKVKQIEKTEAGLKVTIESDSEEVVLTDVVGLAATGRKPSLQGLGLENTRVEVQDGAIAVDDYSGTAEANIYAVGDCIARVELTPVAINEGRAFADTHFGGQDRQMCYENIPTAIFTSPEAATVGLTEAQARERFGDKVKVFCTKFTPTYYALAAKPEKTMMKLVVASESDRVLGAHIVGEHAAEIIQGVAIAVKMGATKADFDATVGIHPTIAEELVSLS
ncbi:MAG: glutathione-disulfide reductase [Jaaginema sp. PMC 1079.18]|nr:glutathione-disulfide reductase [Jaaginema sp. PMC 1080.18]MEC4853696.1 glutathione-disulfide reductase [Jaaginema sp. PMC 1079.18]MEC4869020.1 glutathione-disulfide reductase [Jaaginema sp. PMC 1078.18]